MHCYKNLGEQNTIISITLVHFFLGEKRKNQNFPEGNQDEGKGTCIKSERESFTSKASLKIEVHWAINN